MTLPTVPNTLTFIRILLIPVVVAAMFSNTQVGRWVAALSFCSACVTDYLDGFLARALSQTSRLGQFLDPIADKMLVATTLLLMAGFDKISRLAIIPATIILCREILISGLRETLSELDVNIPVSRLAKWKTAIQMLAIFTILIEDTTLPEKSYIGETLLWMAAILTLITMMDYLKRASRYF
ncbi:CDP-diacylglycerol--glycerol-3-phosphate 3-phosphatidyltransferase [Candidatus Paracaedibacter symbiosus]|uniref:CDP-diacylglycerol--glycerol-3-phosphate 3-phosphatidyltransferase n=1 Tax=Candidatus Paracaedibacter symbiosus TaxID=244582 RepID=UPI000509D000|nr:CDP-diacylglycerol--glycerol-3-phosphate 3-phosphatidyltransferase [Candidatus Paracaedibacter symbiosus]